jgi:hypothetical protein
MKEKRDVCIFTGSGFSSAIFNQKTQDSFIDDFLNSPESKDYIQLLPEDFKSLLNEIKDIELVMSHYSNLAYSSLRDTSTREKYEVDIICIRSAIAIYYRDKFKNINKCYDACDPTPQFDHLQV